MLPLFSPARIVALILLTAGVGRAQFVDEFEGEALNGWFFFTGDGSATMNFRPQGGTALIEVDATQDPDNVWWAIIKRDIGADVDLSRLQDPAYELRVEARIRPSHAPRRVNFMINTQRTADFHEHLREYDLAEAGTWHTISMTTRNLDVRPGDNLFVQLGVTDWGPGRYAVEVDYYKAEVVRRDAAPSDVGEPLVYHPPVPDLATFTQHQPATHDSLIVERYPDVNFNDWSLHDGDTKVPVLTVSHGHWPVLRWDFSALRGRQAQGAGVLELTTHSVMRGGDYIAHYGEDLGIEFGKVRVIEILAGDPNWEQGSVTYRSLLAGAAPDAVFNGQMIFDTDVATSPGGRTQVTLSRPVMQRLLDGTTKGLVLQPLGAITATVFATEDPEGRGPRLHFSVKP